MDTKLKSIIIIFLTLAIGFSAGFLTQSMLHNNRMKQLREKMGKTEGYVEYLKRVSDISAEQEVAVSPILERFAPRLYEHNKQCRNEVRQMVDSLTVELSPYLDANQIEKLKKKFIRRRSYKKPTTSL